MGHSTGFGRISKAYLFCLVAFCLVAPLGIRAAEPAKETPFSVNSPLEIPGMMLDSGQYLFRLGEPAPERNVLQVFETVQIWAGDGARLLSTLLTMPNYDRPTTDKTVFSFFERGPNDPKALRLWFAPGRDYAQEFVYPKLQAVQLAKSAGRAVLSMPLELPADVGRLGMIAAPEPPAAPVTVPRAAPAQRPARIARFVRDTASPVPAVEPVGTRPPGAQPQPKSSGARERSAEIAARAPDASGSLPKTASSLPLLATIGMLGIAGGVLLRLLAMRLERR